MNTMDMWMSGTISQAEGNMDCVTPAPFCMDYFMDYLIMISQNEELPETGIHWGLTNDMDNTLR